LAARSEGESLFTAKANGDEQDPTPPSPLARNLSDEDQPKGMAARTPARAAFLFSKNQEHFPIRRMPVDRRF